jgi:hypothetical protein
MASDRMPVKNPAESEGLSVVDANSPSFLAEVNRLLSPEAISKAQLFLPFSLVLKNNTERYIWGFTVIYRFPDRISASGKPWQFQYSHSARVPDRTRMLAPGGSFFIAPVSDFVAATDAAGHRIRQPFMDEGLDRVIQVFVSQHLNDHIEATVDSVIFEDGLMLGPDTIGTLDKVNSRVRASLDLTESLASRRGAQLRSELQLLSGPGLNADAVDEYSQYTRDTASALLKLLDTRGENPVLESIERIRTAKWFGGANSVRRKQ